MRPHHFFIEDGADNSRHVINSDFLLSLRRGPLPDRDDVEVAVGLARLVHDKLESYGTSSGGEMTNDDIRDAILALRAVLGRIGIGEFDPPFRDFVSFRTYWIRNGASGSYQARRTMLHDLFDSLHDALADLETRAVSSTLAEPVSPHPRTGWSAVDIEISELRRHFRAARTLRITARSVTTVSPLPRR